MADLLQQKEGELASPVLHHTSTVVSGWCSNDWLPEPEWLDCQQLMLLNENP